MALINEKYSSNLFKKVFGRTGIEFKIKLISTIRLLKKMSPEDQFLIFSDPRGGSTWLLEIINTIPRTAIVWEPLHLDHIKQLHDLNFGWRQFIPEDVDWPTAKSFFKQVFSGKIVNNWTMIYTNFMDFLLAKYFIVKICRGNMMLPWITRNFSFSYRPIYLVRHPFAVVNSQLKQGGWDQEQSSYKIPDVPYNDKFIKHKDFLKTLRSKEEFLTASWCITNNVPLKHPENNNKWITIFYEDLLTNPSYEIDRVFNIWNLPIPTGIEVSYRKKSRTTKENSNIDDHEFQLSRWKKGLTVKQIEKMRYILEYFEVEHYSYNEIIPLQKIP